jgi:hypothetical protein
MAAGGLGDYAKNLDRGMSVLDEHRKGDGTWRRFPFFYTLLALCEAGTPNAKRELRYARPEIERKLKTLRRSGEFSLRKRELLTRIAEKQGW